MPHAPVDRLTPRQEEVLALIARGQTNAEIAVTLGISLDGAKFHVAQVLSRLGVDTREEAADFWRSRNGFVPRLRRFATALTTSASLRYLGAGAAVVLVALLALFLLLGRDDDEPAPVTPDATPTPGPAVSLGKFAYAVIEGPGRGIYLQEVDGSARANLLDGVELPGEWREPVVFTPDGSRVAFQGLDEDDPFIAVLSTAGDRQLSVYPIPARLSSLSWSPSLDHIAFSAPMSDQQSDIYVLTLADGTVQNLTESEFLEYRPEWSPDGAMIAFNSCRGCGAFSDIWVMAADGSGQRNLTPEPADRGLAHWAPDSRRIAFWSGPAEAGLYIVDAITGEMRRAGPMLQGDSIAWLPDSEGLVTVAATPEVGTFLALIDLRTGSSSRLSPDGSENPGGNLVISPSGDYVAFVSGAGIVFVDTATGTHRFLRIGAAPFGLAWLPLDPAPGVEPGTLPTPVVQPDFTGDFPAIPSSELDADGWPLLQCPAGETFFRAETRRFVMCVPGQFYPGHGTEHTQDRYWGWVGGWTYGAAGDMPEEQLSVQLMEREHSGPRSGWFSGCRAPRQETFLGVPAHVCVLSPEDDPGIFGLGGWHWGVSIFAETPDYYLVVSAYGAQQGADATAALDRILGALETARIGDPSRVIP